MRCPSSSLPGFGQAKSCILLFLYGSPSQLETFDPKPDAPAEIRGEFGCIPSSVPGLDVCERLPRLAQVMDKVTVIRSVSHPYPIHGVAYATTGIPRIDVPMELNPRDPNHWPFIGSVVDYVDGRRAGQRGRRRPCPRNLVLPWAFSSQRVGEVARAGPVRRLPRPGVRPDLHRVRRHRRPRRPARRSPDKVWDDLEPYRGITPESRFQLGVGRRTSARADARPARPPPHAAGAARADPRDGRCRGVAVVGHRPPPRDGLRPARLGRAPPGVRPRPASRTRPATSTA